jgi:hypothetical protein
MVSLPVSREPRGAECFQARESVQLLLRTPAPLRALFLWFWSSAVGCFADVTGTLWPRSTLPGDGRPATSSSKRKTRKPS